MHSCVSWYADALHRDVSFNRIRSIPAALANTSIGYLFLSSNRIEEVPADVIVGTGQLLMLSLDGNRKLSALPDFKGRQSSLMSL